MGSLVDSYCVSVFPTLGKERSSVRVTCHDNSTGDLFIYTFNKIVDHPINVGGCLTRIPMLLIHANGSPLTHYQFASMLRSMAAAIGISLEHFMPHSFHFGVASAVATAGRSEDEIRTIGC